MMKHASHWTRIVQRTGALLALALVLAGCNRAHYRRQADAEGLALIQEKANNPHWAIENYSLYVDPRSRMFDPFAADLPPMPEDDPTAHQLMHRVDGKRGYPGWHYNGDTEDVENPVWQDYLPLDEQGILRLTADQTVRLGRLHSRAFQAENEELYLSALDVSFERFRFDTQFFAGYQPFYTADGAGRRGGGGQSRSLFAPTTYATGRNVGAWTMQKSFTTGADLVVGMANSLLWQFSGPNDYSGVTLLDFSLVQPLLRNAGKDRVLERLTVAERTLLSNVRAMERYRQAFYVDILTGRSSANDGPRRRGGVLGAGLEGFSGVGSSGFGGITTAAAATGIGGGQAGAGAGQAGGYLGLLQTAMQIRNTEINIRLQRSNLATLGDKEEALGDIDPLTLQAQTEPKVRARLQVAQARQAILVTEGQLINSRNSFQATLDNLKLTLGLPPTVCAEVNDPMLNQFYLIDDELEMRREDLERLRPVWGSQLLSLSNRAKRSKKEVDGIPVDVYELEWNDEVKADLQRVRRDLAAISNFTAKILGDDYPRVKLDEKAFANTVPQRIAQLEVIGKKFEALRGNPCALLQIPDLDPVVFDPKRVLRLQKEVGERMDVLDKALNRCQTDLGGVDARLDKLMKDGGDRTAEQIATEVLAAKKEINSQLDLLRNAILALELAQAQYRAEAIGLTPVDLPHETAVAIAKRYRHDLMNARAALVDSWRLIEFNADNLESTLNLLFSGDVSNRSENPLNLNSSTGRLRVGVQFDAPIVRMSERNVYRQSLIEYQQAKRNYYQFLDNLSRNLRAILRTLETNQFNFELQRYAVAVAAEQNDLNTELLSRPGTGGPTAARDAIQALTDLLTAQNNFLSIWIIYEVQRRQLDLDLGTMRVDGDGIWIDPGPIGPDYLEKVEAIMEYLPPDGWHEHSQRAEPLPTGEPPPPKPDRSDEANGATKGAGGVFSARTALAPASAAAAPKLVSPLVVGAPAEPAVLPTGRDTSGAQPNAAPSNGRVSAEMDPGQRNSVQPAVFNGSGVVVESGVGGNPIRRLPDSAAERRED